MRTPHPQSFLFKATLSLTASCATALMYGAYASKHLICAPCDPKEKEEPLDVSKLAKEFAFKEGRIYDAPDENVEPFLFGPKKRNNFPQPAKNFKRLGTKLGRQTRR